MALQTETSSSLAPTSTSTANNAEPTDGINLDTRNSVPFSFLIAFLALFVVFMGMGLWARRIVFFARRRMGLPVPEEHPSKRQVARPKKPVLWDVYPEKQFQPEKWASFEPLSAAYCTEVPVVTLPRVYEPIHPAWPPPSPPAARTLPRTRGPGIMVVHPPSAAVAEPHPQTWRDYLPVSSYNGFKEWWLDLAHPMRHSLPPKDAATVSSRPNEVQVAVFVAMPSQRSTQPKEASRRGVEELGEMSIGISGTLWHHEDSFTDVLETRT